MDCGGGKMGYIVAFVWGLSDGVTGTGEERRACGGVGDPIV